MKYGGIDLHSNNAVVAVIDDQDRVLYCKRLANDLPSIIAVLAPFHEDLQGGGNQPITGTGLSMA